MPHRARTAGRDITRRAQVLAKTGRTHFLSQVRAFVPNLFTQTRRAGRQVTRSHLSKKPLRLCARASSSSEQSRGRRCGETTWGCAALLFTVEWLSPRLRAGYVCISLLNEWAGSWSGRSRGSYAWQR
ncbi:hypothetical protein BV20DRAFT_805466 [Pilatotrama ljubarskyi]|nr:hypothetical protein BV20DRAFT_805466 [Pilatotrama ljubarskyi]